jgi:hypothetical protein
LHVTDDKVKGAEIAERDKEVDTNCGSWRWKMKGKNQMKSEE